MVTGVAALAGALLSLAQRPRNVSIAALLVVAGVATAAGGSVIVQIVNRQRAEELARGPLAEEMDRPVAAGRARLVLFKREGCYYCEQMESEVISRLQKEFTEVLEIERREAADDMESPTIVVAGRKAQVLTGPPDYDTLRSAVVEALGSK